MQHIQDNNSRNVMTQAEQVMRNNQQNQMHLNNIENDDLVDTKVSLIVLHCAHG